ncbi:hypothetical protein BH23BAC1_BH23BAC1_02430 [soil metagenome]
MELVKTLLLYLVIFSGIFFLIGLYKPWMVLWWKAVSNRLMVIKIYGLILVISLIAYLLFK